MKGFRSDYFIAAALCAIIVLVISSSAAASTIYVKWDFLGTGPRPAFEGVSSYLSSGIRASVQEARCGRGGSS